MATGSRAGTQFVAWIGPGLSKPWSQEGFSIHLTHIIAGIHFTTFTTYCICWVFRYGNESAVKRRQRQ